MANIKTGVISMVGVVIAVILEYLLFPIALTFQSNLNDSSWVSTSDRTILGNSSTLMIVIILMTLIGGVIGSLYVAMKG